MNVVQRGVFASSIWLGFMMNDAHLRVVAPSLMLGIVGSLLFTEFRRSAALRR